MGETQKNWATSQVAQATIFNTISSWKQKMLESEEAPYGRLSGKAQ